MIDYLSQHLWQTWAVIAVICLILELTAGDRCLYADQSVSGPSCGTALFPSA